MALQKNIETIQGLNVSDAYIRVESISLSKNLMHINIKTYVSVEKPCLSAEVFSCAYSLEGQNPFQQAYEYLKTLPEFSGATDC
jgi:hypothetical protein